MAFSDPPAQGRRQFILLSAAALLLAGCATAPRDRPGAPGTGGNRVAVLVPLTGPDAAVGRSLGNAARLAMADTGTRAFELTLFDTAAAGAPAAASRAIAGGHGLILGPLRAEDVRAVTPLAQRARVPVIAFSNDADAAARGAYVIGFTPTQAVERVVAHAASTGIRRFAALVPATPYGQRAAAAFAATVREAGGQVAGIETYSEPTGIRAAARRIAGPVGAVLVADRAEVAALAAPGLPAGTRILGTELWAAGAGASGPRLRGALYAAPTQGRWPQFVQRYKARYAGQTPPRIASLGYDAVLLANRAARGWASGRRFPLGAIEDREGFDGVDGIFRFTGGNVAQRAFEVRQLTSAGSAVVSPAPTRF